jgi:branched-subunit amino acid transport protein
MDTMSDSGERSVLKLFSRFVLEVLPYALSALIAAIIVPGLLIGHFHAAQPNKAVSGIDTNVGAVELVRDAHEALAEQMSSSLSSSVVTRHFLEK